MTQGSTLATDGQDGAPMPTASNAPTPVEFAERCKEIAADLTGHEMHKAFDLLSNETLCSLGYSEGVEIFRAGVRDYHSMDLFA